MSTKLIAQGELQMSSILRQEAIRQFLDVEKKRGYRYIRTLLDLPLQGIATRFNQYWSQDRCAIVVPEGVHFDATETDIAFAEDVYTFRIYQVRVGYV